MRPFTSSSRNLIVFSLAMLLAVTTTQAQNCFVNPRIKKITANISASIKSYMWYKPLGYDANPTKKYPLLVYLGGTGEMFQQPGGSDQDLCPVLQYSMPWRMNVGHFPDVVKDASGNEYSYFVVMPFVTKWEEQYSVDPGAVIDYILAAYPNRIDVNRIYLTGMSRGTDNIMGWVTASTTNSSRIAAMAPAANCFPANVGTPFYTTQVNNLAGGDVRVWGISCQGDKPCPEVYIQNWVSSLNVLKPGYGMFTYATLSCEGPDNSNHYAWNSAYDPDYRAAPGNKNVYEWLIQYAKNAAPPPPPPPTVTPNCSTINVIGQATNIKVKGLLAPVATVQIFNSAWATVYNQTFTNSPDSITTGTLPSGTYLVKVNFYTSAWSSICEKSGNITVGTTTPPPPPPPPPTGTPSCTTITMTGGAKQIQLGGLTAPVIGVQVFNNNWTTAFNQTYTNSPGTVTVSNLAAGTYHVKITFNNASWAYICDKLADVVVTASPEAPPIELLTERSATIASSEIGMEQPTARHIAVAPNPFAGALQVTIGSNTSGQASLVMLDLQGRTMMNMPVTLQLGINRFTIDGSKYKPGSYILKLVTAKGVENVRLLRQ